MQTIKKLSVATVYGRITPTALVKAPDSRLKLMRAVGVAVGIKEGQSDYGNWTGLLGRFECTNLETGEVFRGSTLFLPDVALTPIKVGMSQNGSNGATFAFELDAVMADETKKKAGGSFYEYALRELLDDDESDPLAIINAKVRARLAALPAPTENSSTTQDATSEKGAATARAGKGKARK